MIVTEYMENGSLDSFLRVSNYMDKHTFEAMNGLYDNKDKPSFDGAHTLSVEESNLPQWKENRAQKQSHDTAMTARVLMPVSALNTCVSTAFTKL